MSEAIDRMNYTFRNMQSGEHDWPNSCEGDMLRIAYREITSHERALAQRDQRIAELEGTLSDIRAQLAASEGQAWKAVI